MINFRCLDMGAASGDMGAALRRSFPRATVTSLDRKPDHLEHAALPKLVGDAFRLPFAEGSFDFVFSSFFLHHFSDEEIVRLLASFGGIARRAVLAIDLERGTAGLSLHAGHALALRVARYLDARWSGVGAGGIQAGGIGVAREKSGIGQGPRLDAPSLGPFVAGRASVT